MSNVIKSKIEVEVSDIQVGTTHFQFHYKIVQDGRLKKDEIYDSSHVWANDISGFHLTLENGLAVTLALEQLT